MTTTRSSPATSEAASTAVLQLDYLSSEEIASRSAAWWQNVLGVVGFEKLPPIDGSAVPITASMTPRLGTNDGICEVWRVAGPGVQLSNGAAQHSRVRYRFCEDLLFGSITIDERLLETGSAARVDAAAGVDAGALLRATEIAYQEIFGVLKQTEHRHLIRIWNYLPEINARAGGDERYRHFNSARQTAFRKSGRAIVGTVPAASAS